MSRWFRWLCWHNFGYFGVVTSLTHDTSMMAVMQCVICGKLIVHETKRDPRVRLTRIG